MLNAWGSIIYRLTNFLLAWQIFVQRFNNDCFELSSTKDSLIKVKGLSSEISMRELTTIASVLIVTGQKIIVQDWEKVIEYQKQGEILAIGMFDGKKRV